MVEYPFIRFMLILGLVGLNGFFVASEFALIRVRQTKIDELIKKGSKRAQRVKDVTRDLNRTTSGVQLGVTLASIMLGFIGEEFFSEVITGIFHFFDITFIEANVIAGISFFLGYMIVTFMHVTFGELIPKVFSIQYTEQLALYVAEPIYWFIKFTGPLLNFFIKTSIVILGLFKIPVIQESEAETFSEEELKLVILDSINRGEIEEYESNLIFNILSFTDKNVRDLLTPRIDICALPSTATFEEIIELGVDTGYSRIPIYGKDLDDMKGFVHIKDVFPYILNKTRAGFDIQTLLRDIIIVHEWKPIDDLLKEMQDQKTQMAMIVDEYGAIEGLITIEDIVESIFGPIDDEFDKEDLHELVKIIDDTKILVGGLITIEKFNNVVREKFGCQITSDDSITVAGYVLELFESEIPKINEEREDEEFGYKIKQKTGNRIDLIEITIKHSEK